MANRAEQSRVPLLSSAAGRKRWGEACLHFEDNVICSRATESRLRIICINFSTSYACCFFIPARIKMIGGENNLPYLLTGCIFYAFGLKWCCEYARLWYIRPKPRQHRESPKMGVVPRLKKNCLNMLSSHPIEGCLKLIATAVGLSGTLTGGLPNSGIVSPKVIHATIYLFFAFSGLVDVLHFYFPRNVSDGLSKMALAQSFFIEGFLFVHANVSDSLEVNRILAAIVWLTSVSVTLELVWPEVKLLRGATTILHGGWIAHMVRVFRSESLSMEKIALTFSWHIALASMVTLLAVAITRSCIPREPPPPPQVPIYDYCNEMEIRS